MGSQVVGGIVTVMVGVIVIAAIYQLNKSGGKVTPALSGGYNATLSSLFK